MPTPDLILPGFYGKLPTAGDFVTRRLPIDFVRVWDRWLAQHFAPLIVSEVWGVNVPLRFLSGPFGGRDRAL
jgi:type VI secretion system protein ImpM